MKVIILCGGRGTRLQEETVYRPKPLVDIGGKPILWHIMKIYAHYGFKDFIICLGYKGNMIKDYFLNYEIMNNDFTINLGSKDSIRLHSNHSERDWKITLVDTGDKASTGTRIKKVEKYIDSSPFMATYGDGLCNVDISKLLNFHKKNNRLGTVTGVHPSSRFGELHVKNDKVIKFHEKPQVDEGLINGGFFVFQKDFLKYLTEDDNCVLELEPLRKLAQDGGLSVYTHHGFWQCADTYRELEFLNSLWHSPAPPWKVW